MRLSCWCCTRDVPRRESVTFLFLVRAEERNNESAPELFPDSRPRRAPTPTLFRWSPRNPTVQSSSPEDITQLVFLASLLRFPRYIYTQRGRRKPLSIPHRSAARLIIASSPSLFFFAQLYPEKQAPSPRCSLAQLASSSQAAAPALPHLVQGPSVHHPRPSG